MIGVLYSKLGTEPTSYMSLLGPPGPDPKKSVKVSQSLRHGDSKKSRKVSKP